jgi:hypothetical protein
VKFKLIASIVILAAVYLALAVSGGLDGASSSSQPRRNDGIKLNP